LKDIIKFTNDAPFFEIKLNARMKKFEALIDGLTPWIFAYIEGLKDTGEIAEIIGEIPKEATDVSKNAPSEFADLEFMAKAKMIKSVVSTVSKVRNEAEGVRD
jgi:hypothetical protein